ncbi:hypothetical protein D6C95_01559 [Aureobasidium pullulans]|nr:hypothetical protein D6C95_01559 [Aureobasidium pullulans]
MDSPPSSISGREFPDPLDLQTLQDSRSTIPRYLFKCYSPSSGSRCSTRFIGPRARPTTFGPHTQDILECHLRWGKQIRSEFVSWTNSILVALVYAIRKLEGQDWRDPTGEGICIAVLDTSTVPETVPIYPAGTLMKTFGLPDDAPYKRYNHSWEFLMHGRVRNTPCIQRYSVVAVQEFIDNNFYQVFEPFQNPDQRLWARMDELRKELWSENTGVSDMDRIADMANEFHVEFQLPVALALAAMLKIDTTCVDNIKLLAEEDFKHMKIPSSYSACPVDSSFRSDYYEDTRFYTLLIGVYKQRLVSEQTESISSIRNTAITNSTLAHEANNQRKDSLVAPPSSAIQAESLPGVDGAQQALTKLETVSKLMEMASKLREMASGRRPMYSVELLDFASHIERLQISYVLDGGTW